MSNQRRMLRPFLRRLNSPSTLKPFQYRVCLPVTPLSASIVLKRLLRHYLRFRMIVINMNLHQTSRGVSTFATRIAATQQGRKAPRDEQASHRSKSCDLILSILECCPLQISGIAQTVVGRVSGRRLTMTGVRLPKAFAEGGRGVSSGRFPSGVELVGKSIDK